MLLLIFKRQKKEREVGHPAVAVQYYALSTNGIISSYALICANKPESIKKTVLSCLVSVIKKDLRLRRLSYNNHHAVDAYLSNAPHCTRVGAPKFPPGGRAKMFTGQPRRQPRTQKRESQLCQAAIMCPTPHPLPLLLLLLVSLCSSPTPPP